MEENLKTLLKDMATLASHGRAIADQRLMQRGLERDMKRTLNATCLFFGKTVQEVKRILSLFGEDTTKPPG